MGTGVIPPNNSMSNISMSNNSMSMDVEDIVPSQFANRIPNRFALRDFCNSIYLSPSLSFCLVANKCKKYVPPKRELTMEFARKILSGEKKLLDLTKVNWIQDIPQIKGLSTQRMWNELRNDKTVIMYFPNYSRTRLPSKNYLMNVILISFYYPFQVINTL